MRLFVAVDMPAAVKDEVAALIDRLRPAMPDARWVPRDNLHVTLAFLGETPLVEEVARAVGDAARDAPAFRSSLEALGAFPSPKRARVVWVGLSGASGYAAASDAVWRALEPVGFTPEERPFTAHLTIARLRQPARLEPAADVRAVDFAVEALTLFRSKLGRPAPTYEPVAVAPLASPS